MCSTRRAMYELGLAKETRTGEGAMVLPPPLCYRK